MKTLKLVLLALFSSVLMALSQPNELFSWGNPGLGLIAIVPLYVSLYQTKSYKQSFFIGSLYGGLTHALSSYWLWFFHGFKFWTLGTTSIAYMFIYAFIAMYLRAAIKKGGLVRTIAFASVWILQEWAKSTGFLAYPWGLSAYSWNSILPAIQIAESTGVYGLSFALVFFSASLAELFVPEKNPVELYNDSLQRPISRKILPTELANSEGKLFSLGHLTTSFILILFILAYGFVALANPRIPEHYLEAVMVQNNADSWIDSESKILDTSISLAQKAIDEEGKVPDIIMFSETTLQRPWKGFEKFYKNTPKNRSLYSLPVVNGTYLFTGTPEILDWEEYIATNSVILIDKNGKQVGSYAKMHPVPFAEAIPFWEYESFRNFMQNTVGLRSGWQMGSERILFDLPLKNGKTLSFGAPICFEDAFASLCRDFVLDGAQVLINLTNDSWSDTKSAEIQHFVVARFRSVELRRTLVRSTNSGLSAVVDANGKILEDMPLFESCSKYVSIPVYTAEKSLYLILGDWFVLIAGIFIALLFGISFVDFVVYSWRKRNECR